MPLAEPGSGLLTGINSGLANINKALEFSQEQSLKKLQVKGLLAEKGFTTDEDGNVSAMPYRQAQENFQTQNYAPGGIAETERAAGLVGAKNQVQMGTPGTPETQAAQARTQAFAGFLAPGTSPETTAAMTKGMLGNQEGQMESNISKVVPLQGALASEAAKKYGADLKLQGIEQQLRDKERELDELKSYREQKLKQDQSLGEEKNKNAQIANDVKATEGGLIIPGHEVFRDQPTADRLNPNSMSSRSLQDIVFQNWKGQNPDASKQDIAAMQQSLRGLSADDINHNKELAPLIKTKSSYGQTAIGRLEEQKNQNSVQAGHAFEADPIIKLSKTNLNSLTKSLSILDNPHKPVTTRDLNLAYTDYINAVAAGGAATEGKINRELPHTFETEFNDIKQYFGTNDDIRKDPAGAKLLKMLRENIASVQTDMRDQIGAQASSLYKNYAAHTNPKVQNIAKSKYRLYGGDKWDQKQSQGSPGLLPAPQGGSPAPGAIILKGYRFKGGDPSDKNSWEKVQ